MKKGHWATVANFIQCYSK